MGKEDSRVRVLVGLVLAEVRRPSRSLLMLLLRRQRVLWRFVMSDFEFRASKVVPWSLLLESQV